VYALILPFFPARVSVEKWAIREQSLELATTLCQNILLWALPSLMRRRISSEKLMMSLPSFVVGHWNYHKNDIIFLVKSQIQAKGSISPHQLKEKTA